MLENNLPENQMNAQRPIYEKGPHKELANLQQQNIINENIIEQLQIRIQQDDNKIEKLLRVFEDIDDCFSQNSPDLIYIKARIKDVLKQYYKLHT